MLLKLSKKDKCLAFTKHSIHKINKTHMKNLHFKFLTIIILVASLNLNAQNFNYLYSFPDAPDNELTSSQTSMVIDADGSTVSIQNNTEGPSSPYSDAKNALVTKIDALGNVLWLKQLGGLDYDDEVNGICRTDDGGYLVVGSRGKIGIEYRSWVIRLDNNGNLMWDYLVPQQGNNTEFLLVSRTSETAENYMLIGKTRNTASITGDRITAMKISGGGSPFWHYIYNRLYMEDLTTSDLPTTLVQDTNLPGVVVAGLCIEGFSLSNENGGVRTGNSDLFTIGFGLDGSISRLYKKHDIYITNSITSGIESKPHIIQDSRNNGSYAMVFGTDFSKLDANNGSYFTFMQLGPDLSVQSVSHYTNGHNLDKDNVANGIHANANGDYGISCNTSDDSGYIIGSFDQTSFLRLDPTGAELGYVRYNTQINSKSVFLDYDDIENKFVLKTLNLELPNLGLGFFKTEMDGQGECSQQSSTERLAGFYDTQIILNDEEEINKMPIGFITNIWDTDANLTPCGQLYPAFGRSIQDNEVSEKSIEIFVFPSIIDNSIGEVTVKIESDSDYTGEVKIIDMQGKLVAKQNVMITKGTNEISINKNDFALGINSIILMNENKIIATSRISKF